MEKNRSRKKLNDQANVRRFSKKKKNKGTGKTTVASLISLAGTVVWFNLAVAYDDQEKTKTSWTGGKEKSK